MKKFIAFMLCAIATVGVSAQKKNVEKEDVDVDFNVSDDAFSLSIAGFKIGFDNDREEPAPKDTVFSVYSERKGKSHSLSVHRSRSVVDFNLIGPIYHGWGHLTQSSYYGNWAGQGDFLQLDKALSFGLQFCTVSMTLNPSHSLKFEIGARWTYTNYYLMKRVWIDADNDLKPFPNPYGDERASTPVLRSSYIGFPVGFSYRHHGFKASASISAEWLTRQYERVRGNQQKYPLYAFSDFRSAVELAVGYHGIGAYVNYSLTPLFASGSGNDAHYLTVGFVLAL